MNRLGGSGHQLILSLLPFICLCRGSGSGLKWKLRLGHTEIEDLGHCDFGGGDICREEAGLGRPELALPCGPFRSSLAERHLVVIVETGLTSSFLVKKSKKGEMGVWVSHLCLGS